MVERALRLRRHREEHQRDHTIPNLVRTNLYCESGMSSFATSPYCENSSSSSFDSAVYGKFFTKITLSLRATFSPRATA